MRLQGRVVFITSVYHIIAFTCKLSSTTLSRPARASHSSHSTLDSSIKKHFCYQSQLKLVFLLQTLQTCRTSTFFRRTLIHPRLPSKSSISPDLSFYGHFTAFHPAELTARAIKGHQRSVLAKITSLGSDMRKSFSINDVSCFGIAARFCKRTKQKICE